MCLLRPWCCLEKAKVCKSWSVIIYIYICIYIIYLQNPTRTYNKLRCTGDAKIKMSEYVCAAKVINNFGTIMGPWQSSPCIELCSSDPNKIFNGRKRFWSGFGIDLRHSKARPVNTANISWFCCLICSFLPKQVYNEKRKLLHCFDIHRFIPPKDLRDKQNIQLW